MSTSTPPQALFNVHLYAIRTRIALQAHCKPAAIRLRTRIALQRPGSTPPVSRPSRGQGQVRHSPLLHLNCTVNCMCPFLLTYPFPFLLTFDESNMRQGAWSSAQGTYPAWLGRRQRLVAAAGCAARCLGLRLRPRSPGSASLRSESASTKSSVAVGLPLRFAVVPLLAHMAPDRAVWQESSIPSKESSGLTGLEIRHNNGLEDPRSA